MKRDLFPLDEVSNLRCQECQADMVNTPSGWLACPNGHGKLICEAEPGDDDMEGAWGHWCDVP